MNTNLPKDTFLEDHDKFADCEGDDEFEVSDKPRVRRFLDEQFDLLTLREYDTDSGDEDAGYMGTEDAPLAAKISDALKPYAMDNFELGRKYRAPEDLDRDLHRPDIGPELDLSTDIIQKCVEYAEKYCNESQDDKEVVLFEESSDESEVWDCETIVSTYSNLDNHPRKIQAPQNPKKRMSKSLPGDPVMKDNAIMLGGKEKLPVEFLPHNKKTVEKVKASVKASGIDYQKRRPHGEESKEEKKERKNVLVGGAMQSRSSIFELVQCRLTLYYNYWQINELLAALLPEGIIVPAGFETVGHIAHLNLSNEHLPYKKLIAEVVLDKNKPKIQTVVNKIDAIQNDYRTMELEVLAGNRSLVTTVIENGICFQVYLGAVYVPLFPNNTGILDWLLKGKGLTVAFQTLMWSVMYSQVSAPYLSMQQKKVKYVYANDLNPNDVEYLERNIVLNKLDRKIEVSNMDGRRFIRSIFGKSRGYRITQVVMNLPKDAAEFLDCFRGIFARRPEGISCTLSKVHVYGFSKAEHPEFDFQERINMVLCTMVDKVEMHRVRLVVHGKP